MKKRRKKLVTVTTENATHYGEKRSNTFTWLQYGWLAHKLYLWACDNKEFIHEVLHSIIDFVLE